MSDREKDLLAQNEHLKRALDMACNLLSFSSTLKDGSQKDKYVQQFLKMSEL